PDAHHLAGSFGAISFGIGKNNETSGGRSGRWSHYHHLSRETRSLPGRARRRPADRDSRRTCRYSLLSPRRRVLVSTAAFAFHSVYRARARRPSRARG